MCCLATWGEGVRGGGGGGGGQRWEIGQLLAGHVLLSNRPGNTCVTRSRGK